MHRVEALRLVVPLEHRKVHDPQRSEPLGIAQAELLGHFQTQGAQLRERAELGSRHKEDHIARRSTARLGHGTHLVGRVELVDRRLDGIGLDADPDQPLGAHLRPLDELGQRGDLLAGVTRASRSGEAADVLRIVEHAEPVPLDAAGHVVELHAEMQALTAASSTLGGKYLRDCTLYVTVEPCVMCAGAIAWSQAARVVWGADDPKRGYTTVEGLRLHPRTVVVRGVLAAECEALMKEFFKELR